MKHASEMTVYYVSGQGIGRKFRVNSLTDDVSGQGFGESLIRLRDRILELLKSQRDGDRPYPICANWCSKVA